eukprot:c23278_g1_i1 orf=433-2988(-)
MTGHKGEGANQSQGKGALGAGERGPLFPRLHVNETEKTGPKAPPRNKMALYEQFTVPSHRFVQPSQISATTLYQQQYGSHELGYPYLPCYMPSVPYAKTSHAVQVYAQPSHGTSSSGVTNGSSVANKELPQKGGRHHKVGKSSPCKDSRGLIGASADCVTRGLSELKGQDAYAPAQSSFTNLAEDSTNAVPDVLPDTSIMDITESLEEVLSTVEVGMEQREPDGQNCRRPRSKCLADRERSTCMTERGQLQQAAQYSVYETLTKQTKESASIKSPREACLQTGSTRAGCKRDPVTQGLTSHAHCTRLSAFTGGEPSRNCGRKDAQENSIADVEIVGHSIGLSATALARPSVESSEELKIISKRNSQVSQQSGCRIRKGGHSHDMVVPSTSSDSLPLFKPKNVMQAIGQQQFWQARKTLLRQQRIFSDQVFQLHKLIKVQQLLAETPGTLIDEETLLETREECNAAAPLAKRAINFGEHAQNVGFDFKGSKGMSLEAGGQPKNKGEHSQTVGRDAEGSSKLMSEFSSGGVTAWGYPNLGQLAGPMAAQGQPIGFRPFYGTLPPGSAFSLPGGSVPQGSVSPMISFGIPFCDPRQEFPAEMGSNYWLPTVFDHEGSGTASGYSSRVSDNLGGSCYNYLSYQRIHAAQDVSTGSGASANISPTTVRGVKTSCVPGSSYQSGPSNTDGLDSYAHRSEISSCSDATRLKGHKFPSTPLISASKKVGFCHQDVEGLAHTSDLASAYGSGSSDQYDNSRGSGEEKELNARILSQSKGQKEGVCLSSQLSDADEHSSDLSHSALELFPLVPLLGSSGRNGEKAAEGGQGSIIRAVPRRAIAASESAAGILLSLQRERQK